VGITSRKRGRSSLKVLVNFLGGALLGEEKLVAVLEGVKLGYDMRLVANPSIERLATARPLVLDRLCVLRARARVRCHRSLRRDAIVSAWSMAKRDSMIPTIGTAGTRYRPTSRV
jgi:hypothetical protein